jgi:CBS domain-containing protein
MKSKLKPQLQLDPAKSSLRIGKKKIVLPPMQFCYYRFFVERSLSREGPLVLKNESTEAFINTILEFHRESFPGGDSFRQLLEARRGRDLSTIRAHISKLNTFLRNQLRDPELFEQFKIRPTGPRGATVYELVLPESRIKVLSLQVYPRFKRNLKTFCPDDTLVSVLKLMKEKDYSQVVVFVDRKPRLLTTDGIAQWMLHNVRPRIDLRDVEIHDVLPFEREDSFVVFNKDQLVREARETLLNSLTRHSPRTFAILVVDKGVSPPKLLGIITPWDFLDQDYW